MSNRLVELEREVYELLAERGSLTKHDIDVRFVPTPDEYVYLRRELQRRPRVRSGPQRTGGFTIEQSRSAAVTEADTDIGAQLEPWEAAAVSRLEQLLGHEHLEALLGDLAYTFRALRKEETGIDRRGSKRELAQALVVKHGVELLQDREVREAVCARLRVECAKTGCPPVEFPGRWHPGKSAAIAFVREAGFPMELSGVVSDDRPADFEYLEGRVALEGLADFQEEVKRCARQVLDRPEGRAIVTLPTGAGKTRTAVETLKEWLTEQHSSHGDTSGSVVLWLAHTEELCEQAYACFKQVWEWSQNVCPLYLVRFWGSYTRDLHEHRETLERAAASPSVFISTPQRLLNLVDDAKSAWPEVLSALRANLGAIVIDEAHRAAAPSYLRVLDVFSAPARPRLLGLTATPFRHEYTGSSAGTQALFEVFRQHLIEPVKTLGNDPRQRLQELGVLAKPILESLETNVRLRLPDDTPEDPDDTEIERVDHALKLEADRTRRRLLVLKRVLQICEENAANSVLYFGPSVRDAEHMAFLLRQRRHSSAVVSGTTRDATRRQVISRFKAGQIRVLCNCEVLTTGFDAPRVTHIVVARPTVSQVLFEQMVGRGLRGPKFGGTADCVIVNCEDDYRASRPQLGHVGWRQIWQPQTRSRAARES